MALRVLEASLETFNMMKMYRKTCYRIYNFLESHVAIDDMSIILTL